MNFGQEQTVEVDVCLPCLFNLCDMRDFIFLSQYSGLMFLLTGNTTCSHSDAKQRPTRWLENTWCETSQTEAQKRCKRRRCYNFGGCTIQHDIVKHVRMILKRQQRKPRETSLYVLRYSHVTYYSSWAMTVPKRSMQQPLNDAV